MTLEIAVGSLGFLVIDRVVAGRCCGGVRMSPSVAPDEVRRLAGVMTLKCGWLGLAAGGAKAGIVAPGPDASPAARAERVRAFGRAVAPLLRTGIWSLGPDLGTTPTDIARIRWAAGLGLGAHGHAGAPVAPARRSRRCVDESGGGLTGFPARGSSGDHAGLTAALAAFEALRARGIDPRGARAAVQGAGAVGRAAMRFLAREGVRIVAVSTVAGTIASDDGLDAEAIATLAAREGDRFVLRGGEAREPGAVLDVPCDLFVPCAASGTIDLAAARRARWRVVVAGANDPFARGAAEALLGAGVLVVPDFVANGGGVLGSTLEVAGATPGETEALIRRRFPARVARTLDEAVRHGETVAEAARRRALRNLAACERAYDGRRPPTLLPEALAPAPPALRRALLRLERRVRGSRKLAPLARRLHPLALARLDAILGAGT